MRVAIVVSHPIQHFCPQYASFAKNRKVFLKVFFASALGSKKYYDPDFKKEISWGNLYLDRFDHVFLNGQNRVIPPDSKLDAPSLNDELDEFKPDLVVIYGYFQALQRRAHRWAGSRKVKLAYISDSELRHKRNPFKELLKYLFIRQYFSGINYFLSVGKANEEYYTHYGVTTKKIVSMHFPIDIGSYEQSYEKREELRKTIRLRHLVKDNELILLVVGKLVPWKNQDHIIDALLLLEKRNIYLHLFMLGSGKMQSAWEKRVLDLKHSKVHFTGFVNSEDLPAYYAASDMYVHPASLEPHSIAISEAIYMGCPVIISDRCGSYGAEDDVQEGRNGFVFPFGDIQTLAAKVQFLINADIRRSFSQHSHALAVQFQRRAHLDILTELIQRF